MGRKKPGKPRRPRVPRQYALHELQPPGEAYEEWFVTADMDSDLIVDPQLDGEALDLLKRMARLGPLYGNRLPKAALYLDELIDTGKLPVFGHGTQKGTLLPLAEAAAWMGAEGDLRASIHRLHAVGALLVDTDDEHDLAFIRLVAKRPEEPGQPWRFQGDPDAVTATTCIPNRIWEELPLEVAGAVAYLRTCQSQLEDPDPEAFGQHDGVNGTDHARKLFAAARESGAVDEKGCEACPVGHLCTRTES